MKKLGLLFFSIALLFALSASTCEKTNIRPGTNGGALDTTGGSGGGGGGTVRKKGDIGVSVVRGTTAGSPVEGATVTVAINKAEYDKGNYIAQNVTQDQGKTLFKDLEPDVYYMYAYALEGADTLKGDLENVIVSANNVKNVQMIIAK